MAYAVRPLTPPIVPRGLAGDPPFDPVSFAVIGSIHTPPGNFFDVYDIYGPMQFLRSTDPILNMIVRPPITVEQYQRRLHLGQLVHHGRKTRILEEDIRLCGPFVMKTRAEFVPTHFLHLPPGVQSESFV